MAAAYRVACGAYERTVFAVDVVVAENGTDVTITPLFVSAAHVGCVKVLAVGGDILASGSTDEVIKLVNLKARVEVGALHHHQGSITSLQFHKGTHLISASEDGTLAIWRTKDWELMKDMRGHTGAVNSVAIHPSGQIAVSVARDRTMRLWDLTKGRQSFIKKLKSEGHMVRWDHAGELYAVQYDRAIEVYRVADGALLTRIDHKTRINAFVMTADNELVLGDEDGRIAVFGVLTGEALREAKQPTSRIRDLQIIDRLLFTVASDGMLRVWDLATLKELGSHNSTLRLTGVAVCPRPEATPVREITPPAPVTVAEPARKRSKHAPTETASDAGSSKSAPVPASKPSKKARSAH